MSRELGDAAESRAADFLKENGYAVLERNYFARVGEIDIVAEKDGFLCFVEVKDRSCGQFGGAAAAITKSKISKIVKSAKRYLHQKRLLDVDWRLDAVLIDGNNEPEIIENIYIEGMS